MSKLATAASLVLVPSLASAHPEHATGGDFGLLHLITDPFHATLAAAVVVLFLAARRKLQLRSAANR
jgi:hypothetical protein